VECNWNNCAGVQSAWIYRSRDGHYVYIECHQENRPLLGPALSNAETNVSHSQKPASHATIETVSMRPRPHTQELYFGTAATTAQSFPGTSASYDDTAILCPTQAASGYNSVYGDS
jgi:hypothetical protein